MLYDIERAVYFGILQRIHVGHSDAVYDLPNRQISLFCCKTLCLCKFTLSDHDHDGNPRGNAEDFVRFIRPIA